MQFSTLAIAALASLASAQTSGTTVHVVSVGLNGTLTFSPDNLKPAAGDMVQFQFLAGNHTVTQSTFDNPCQPISMHSTNVTGFHSGFEPAKAAMDKGMISTYTITVNDTKPIWIYCAQGKHCEAGMVMVLNENTASNKTLAAYKSLAAGASTVAPGGASNTTTGGTTGTTTTGGASSPAATTAGAMGMAVPSAVVGLLAVVAAAFML